MASHPADAASTAGPATPAATPKLSRRRLLAAGAAGGAALALGRGHGAVGWPAVHVAAAKAAPTEIQFWKPPHSTKEAELWKPLLDEFTQQHADIHVTHNVVPWDSVDEAFTAAFAGGNPPDVFYLPDEWYPKYVSQGQIADLSSEFGDLQGNYAPNMWAAGTYQGKLYGIPLLAVIHALLLNMNLFEGAGLEAPQSWAEIEEAAKKLTDTSKGIYGLGYSQGTPWTFLTALLATGGARVLSDDLKSVAANTPGGVAAWQAALERIGWQDKAIIPVSTTEDQERDLSLKSQIAMMWAEESQIKALWRTQAPDVKLDVVPLPKQEGFAGQPSVWTNEGFLFIAENSQHKDQAAELVRFLASKHVQEEYVIKGVDLISPMVGVDPGDVDPIVAKYLSYLPQGVGPVMSTHWVDATQGMAQESQAIVTGQKNAQQALADFAATVDPTLDGQ